MCIMQFNLWFRPFLELKQINQDVYFWLIGSSVEIALTGTALPVLLTLCPTYKFDFGECPVGEHADVLCTIKNESTSLPATFQFRRIAHFTTHPPNGKIPPSHTQDVIFSFSPKQVGEWLLVRIHIVTIMKDANYGLKKPWGFGL